MLSLLLMLAAGTVVAPAPDPRIEWKTYPTDGFILCAPFTQGRPVTPCIPLPPGSYLVVPFLTTEPDTTLNKEKT